MTNPTDEAYTEFRQAFDHFNNELFNGKLDVPMFTFQREKRTVGFHTKQSFASIKTGEMVDEIAMNPAYFFFRTAQNTLSTLVHEMVHQWQHAFGHPGRTRYHNKEWAFKMREVGLEPSDTGEPGGKDVGDRMSHYILPGGKFDVSCDALLKSELETADGTKRQFQLSWVDRYPAERPPKRAKPDGEAGAAPGEDSESSDDEDADMVEGMDMIVMPPEEPKNKSNRLGFTCLECGQNIWGKPATVVQCGMPECRGAPMSPGTSRKKKGPE